MDEYDGYSEEEEEELSPEDRALMAQGTADVQAALGVEASKVTVAQIEEALWHYYYDVDKSVAYLTAKFVNPRPKPTKPAAKQPIGKSLATANDPAASALLDELQTPSYWARDYVDMTGDRSKEPQMHHTAFPGPPHLISKRRKSVSQLFRDMPWGNVPRHREAILIPPPLSRGGLLGGSGAPPKMSKLQALAAARKKKAEEKSASQDKVEQTRAKMTELVVSESSAAGESSHLAGAFSKRLKTSESTAQGRLPLVPSEPTRAEPSERLAFGHPAEDGTAQLPGDSVVDKAQQSAFAQTLFGYPSDTFKGERQESYSLYADLPLSVLDAFSQPSPDDVVLAAQAKGSLLGKGKR